MALLVLLKDLKPSVTNGFYLYRAPSSKAFNLMAKSGLLVHEWETEKNCPKSKINYSKTDGRLQHAHLSKSGDLYAIFKHQELVKYTWEGKKLWHRCLPLHHELLERKGKLYTVALKQRKIKYRGFLITFSIDELLELNPKNGEVISRHNLFKALSNAGVNFNFNMAFRKFTKEKRLYEVMHTNSLFIADRQIKGFMNEGDFLISLKHLDLLVVYSPEYKKITWQWSYPDLFGQHTASILKNGHVLLLNNGRKSTGSMAIELEPVSKQIVWLFPTNNDKKFYTQTMGNVQSLPNGNILFANGHNGTAYEINRAGEEVWHWENTKRKDRNLPAQRPQVYYRLTFYPADYTSKFKTINPTRY